jgi:hypothetical protein
MSVEIAFPIEFVVDGTPIPLVHAVKLPDRHRNEPAPVRAPRSGSFPAYFLA